MDGKLSFVEQDANQNDPATESISQHLQIRLIRSKNNARAPAGQTVLGRHSFGYFSIAADRKVTRHKGETSGYKNNTPKSHWIPDTSIRG